MRILYAESDDRVYRAVSVLLEMHDHVVVRTGEYEDATLLCSVDEFDVAILGRAKGCSLAEAISMLRRREASLPLVVLGEPVPPAVVASYLQKGADDVLALPVHAGELRARLDAVVRRSQGRTTAVFTIDDLEVNPNLQMAFWKGELVGLSAKEFKILEVLAARQGICVTKNQLMDHLYGGRDEPGSKIVDVFVCKLRRKLVDTCGKHPIGTVWGRGYCIQEGQWYLETNGGCSAVVGARLDRVRDVDVEAAHASAV